jgi:COMPASS component SWD1
MNLEALDPFQTLPEIIEDTLFSGVASCLAFNRRGSLLAVGGNDGTVSLWDFDTRGIAKKITAHANFVSSVSWSRSGRKILTAGYDAKVCLWNIETVSLDSSAAFDGVVLSAQMHPVKNDVCIAFPANGIPVTMNLAQRNAAVAAIPVHQEDAEEREQKEPVKSRIVGNGYAGTYDASGTRIYLASPKGVVTIHHGDTLQVLSVIKACSLPVKNVVAYKRGDYFLVNSADRSIRVFDAKTSSQVHEFQDPVNKTQWKTCFFSPDGEHIIGASAQKAQHDLYIWSRTGGQLMKILEGPKEGVMDATWHPTRPIIASCSTHGVIYIWTTNYTYFQNWSAFAPDFTELEENEEYVEREDEFDLDREDEKKRSQEDENEAVDIVGLSEEEQEEEVFFLPTHPLPDPSTGAESSAGLAAEVEPGTVHAH